MKLDAHQHFWSYDAAQYPWIPRLAAAPDWLPADPRRYSPPGLDSASRSGAADAGIALAAKLADGRRSSRAWWAGWTAQRAGGSSLRNSRAAEVPRRRHVVQDEPDDRFLLGEAFVRGIGQLHDFGLTYDILIFPKQLPAAIELVGRFPQQPFVLDHIAKPPIKAGTLSPWREQIRELAAAPHVMCKISGMVTEADYAAWKPADFTPYLDVVFEAFGEDRVMYGSDWPVCLLAASYARQHALVAEYAARFSPAAQTKLFGRNASRFYLGDGP